MRSLFYLLSLCLFKVFSLHAEDPNTVKEPSLVSNLFAEGQNYNYWKDFVNMLVTLLVILALVFASVWFLKRVMRSRMRQLNRTTGIKVLERRALTTKSSLYLVSILGKGVVIAESPAGIQCITELSADQDVELLLEKKQQQVDENSPSSFAAIMQKKVKAMMKRDAHT